MTISLSALNHLCPKGENGYHYMMIYDEIDLLREVYTGLAKIILENNGVLLIFTYFETPAKVLFFLKEAGIDVEYHEKGENLFVIDSVAQFFNSSAEDVMRFIELLNKKTLRQGKNGVTAIIDMDALFHFSLQEEFERFESQAGPEGNDSKFRCLLCAYHKHRFDVLPENVKTSLRNRHRSGIDEKGTILSQTF